MLTSKRKKGPPGTALRASIRIGAVALQSSATRSQACCTTEYSTSASCSFCESAREFAVTGTVPFHGATPLTWSNRVTTGRAQCFSLRPTSCCSQYIYTQHYPRDAIAYGISPRRHDGDCDLLIGTVDLVSIFSSTCLLTSISTASPSLSNVRTASSISDFLRTRVTP